MGLEDLSDAVEELERRLEGTGLVVHRFDGKLSLQPATVPDRDGLVVATRAAIARANLGSDRLAMLRDLCSKPRQIDPRFSDPWVSGQLVNAGLVERGVDPSDESTRRARLTDDVRFSLMLDDPGS